MACGKAATAELKLLRCSVCRAAYFCSRQCQLDAWPAHKRSCSKSSPRGAESPAGGASRPAPPLKDATPSRPGSDPARAAGERDAADELAAEADKLFGTSTASGYRDAAAKWTASADAAAEVGARCGAGEADEAKRQLCREAKMREAAAHSLLRAGDHASALRAADAAVGAATKSGDTSLRVEALSTRGCVKLRTAGAAAACVDHAAAVSLCDAAADGGDEEALRPESVAVANNNLGRCLHALGREEDAIKRVRKSVHIRRTIVRELAREGDARGLPEATRALAGALINLGAMQGSTEDMGSVREAKATLEEALVLARSVGDAETERTALTNLVNIGEDGAPVIGGPSRGRDDDEAGGGTPASDGTEEQPGGAERQAQAAERQHTEALRAVLARTGREVGEACVICLDPLGEEPMLALGCGHLFHRRCALRWSQQTSNCPQCQAPMVL